MTDCKQRKLRSQARFGGIDKDGFIHRSWMRNQGLPSHAFDGRPIIGICNTYSELTPCNAHFRDLSEAVKRGVIEAGGWPLEFPVFSCGESNLQPTAMLFRDIVGISDARMSGTAFGTVVLHVAPESVAGGPLAIVRDGDRIHLDVGTRRLDLLIDDAELRARLMVWKAPEPIRQSGYQGLDVERVLQADEGADLDFLVGCRGADVPRESH